MHTIKNLTNSPYDIRVKGGKVERLPARGKLEDITIDPMWMPFYRTLGYFEIAEGESAPAPANDIADLRKEYEELVGKRPYMGWDAEELQKRIDAKLEE